jgi:hypothetical protein
MNDDLTPPHWGSDTDPNEISAMVERLQTHEDVPVSVIADAITAQAAELALARECIANLEEMQARDEAALAAAEARVAVLEGALMDIRSHYTSDQGAYAGIVARAYLKRGAV